MQRDTPSPRVLVIRGGAIGDFILTLPAIRLLRNSIPEVRIEILGYKPIVELAVSAGLAESVRSLEHGSMAKLFVPGVTLDRELLEYFRGFNLVVSYLYDPDGYFRGNMERIGVRTFLAASHHVEPGAGHAAVQLARPLEKLAMYLDDPAPQIGLAVPTNHSRGSPVIAIHPGSGSLKKNWPTANWSRLGRELSEVFPHCRLALVTGEAEAERGVTKVMLEGWRELDFLHWDQMPLTQLAANLSTCAAFLGHDSGISHLAAACGLPCLLLFGPSDPATWAPVNAGVKVLSEASGDLQRMPFEMVRAAAGGLIGGLPDKKSASGL